MVLYESEVKEGKQKELIFSAKGRMTWRELASFLKVSKAYLSRDLKREKILISKETYTKLCSISKRDFNDFIIERLQDNWGRSKGGLNSKGTTIKLSEPIFDEKLAEFIGAVLGDGNIHSYKKGKRTGTYCIRIAGDYKRDKHYHNYLKKLSDSLFNLNTKEVIFPKRNERFLNFYSKELVEFFIKQGLIPGDKIKNQLTIPKWIFENDLFLRACLRGLIDTDGCIHQMSKKDSQLLRIKFTNYNFKLLADVRKAFIILGFSPSKIICNRDVYLSRKSDIEKYLREIGFSNEKHIKRLQGFK